MKIYFFTIFILSICSSQDHASFNENLSTDEFYIRIIERNHVVGNREIIIKDRKCKIFEKIDYQSSANATTYSKSVRKSKYSRLKELTHDIVHDYPTYSKFGEPKIGLDYLGIELYCPVESKTTVIELQFAYLKDLEPISREVNSLLPNRIRIQKYNHL